MLRRVWLNNNKGALRHLSCLRVLLLHNNQMKRLDETVAELRNMLELHTLSLYLNPFTQDPDYRQYVLHHLSSVQLLDREEVKQGERRQAFKIFNTDRQRVLDSIAFGRRALPPLTGRKGIDKSTKPAGQRGTRDRCMKWVLHGCTDFK